MKRSIRKLQLKYYVDMLKNNQPFVFARYGDGEIRTILGEKYENKKNSNGCTFSPYLRSLLRLSLFCAGDHYYHGILRIALRDNRKNFNQFQKKNGVDIHWVDGDILLNECLAGNLFPFIEQLRTKNILMVGQPFLHKLLNHQFFYWENFIIPAKINAINEKERLLSLVFQSIEQFDHSVILWQSGLASKVFISDTYAKYPNVTQIDCGSMWDGFCGQSSRSYIRRGKVDWKSLVEVNSGKREKIENETFRF